MTVIAGFDRLESTGIWRKSPESQRIDVIVTLGATSLELRDNAERPLTHWSLAAIDRISGDSLGATYSPDPDNAETLEIKDPLMIEALNKVHRAINKTRPHRGGLRALLAGLLIASGVALAVFWLPGALIRQAQSSLPEAARRDIDRQVLRQIETISGPRCRSPRGERTLSQISSAFSSSAPIYVVPGTLPQTLALPGGTIIVAQEALERASDPAQIIELIAAARAYGPEPLDTLLAEAGMTATLRLLGTGTLRQGDVAHITRIWATQGQGTPPESPAPYSTIDVTDSDWIALQTICGF